MLSLRRLVSGAALLALAMGADAGAARAAGIAASFECAMHEGGVSVHMSPCNTNTGTTRIVAQFNPPDGITSLRRVVVTYELCGDWNTVPAWWDFFNPGSCRQSSLQWLAPLEASDCGGIPWASVPVGGSIVSFGRESGSGPYRIVTESHTVDGSGVAVPPLNESGLEAYEAVWMTIDNANSSGGGACAGCLRPASLWLKQIDLEMADGSPTITLTRGLNDIEETRELRWQSYVPACLPVPVRTTTWGSLKSIYR